MPSDDLKRTELTRMTAATGDPSDQNELKAQLATARFGELMGAERQRRALLRSILYVLIAIFFSILVQPFLPLLVSRLVHHSSHAENPPTMNLTPFQSDRRPFQ